METSETLNQKIFDLQVIGEEAYKKHGVTTSFTISGVEKNVLKEVAEEQGIQITKPDSFYPANHIYLKFTWGSIDVTGKRLVMVTSFEEVEV